MGCPKDKRLTRGLLAKGMLIVQKQSINAKRSNYSTNANEELSMVCLNLTFVLQCYD